MSLMGLDEFIVIGGYFDICGNDGLINLMGVEKFIFIGGIFSV